MPTLYYGDNLGVMREHLKDASVDLIYLDPPFNSKRDYNVLFKSPKGEAAEAQITAFEDTWHWNMQAEREFEELMHQPNTDVAELMRALRSFLGENDMMAYLTAMAIRLLEMHRVLKNTGSLYLHCDPTASHYLKIVLDGVFGNENFRNEIIWMRAMAKGLTTRALPNNHDTLLCYQRSEESTWHDELMFEAYDEDDLDEKTEAKYSQVDEDGRRYQLTSLINPNSNRPNLTYEFLGITKVWRWTRERMQEAYANGLVVQTAEGNVPRYKRYLDEQRGKPIADVWTDIPPINSQAQERLGYPTQKPLALLERIIQASSNEGDVVLDPFCGCGTAVDAAQKLKRDWIGIDITHLAVSLIEKRMKDRYGAGLKFEVVGTPKDLEAARDLAQRNRYQFQWWATSLVNAQPYQAKKKGPDSGIDGVKYFHDVDEDGLKKILVSVKSGKLKADDVRAFNHVREREKAEIGLFITLSKPTAGMVSDAAAAGFYTYADRSERKVPRMQILTIEDLLSGKKRAEHPDQRPDVNFKKAKRETGKKGQEKLF
ncbi:MAG: restriction endonuclease [Flavobacteriales bacterium]|nr:restriction endonuclease [Flavobacteriales bacterium]